MIAHHSSTFRFPSVFLAPVMYRSFVALQNAIDAGRVTETSFRALCRDVRAGKFKLKYPEDQTQSLVAIYQECPERRMQV
jgi:hypothetical protein